MVQVTTYRPYTDNNLICKYEYIKKLKREAADLEWEDKCAEHIRDRIKRLEESQSDFIANF